MNTAETKAQAIKIEKTIVPGASCSVLVAEDSPTFRIILTKWLSTWGYQTNVATNGVEAWEVLQKPGAPSLVILDWIMPGLDGLELCRRIRARRLSRYVYILMLTANNKKEEIVAGLEAGADDYLTKPFNAEELEARLRSGRRILQLQEDLIAAQEELRFQATHDALTGVSNRGSILDGLDNELARARRTGRTVTVFLLDLDHFKRVNDTYGHQAGDAVLREVGQRLVSSVRTYDSVGRYGGEEFLVVAPEVGPEGLMDYGERLRIRIAETPVDTGDHKLPITASFGAASLTPQDVTITRELLIHAADIALYNAKRNGRNRVCAGEIATRLQ
jgi:diguanylate cyclase (GGDEF)-like protein